MKKKKKIAGDIIILYVPTKNHNHMMCGSLDTEWDRQDQNFETVKKTPWDIILLHICTINEDHKIYGSWNIRHNIQNFCHFGSFLPFHPSDNTEKQNFEKLKKTPQNIIILHLCTTNDNHMINHSWDMEHNWQNFWQLFALLPPP